MSTIYLLKYNNYYNRKVLKLDTLGDYLTTDRLLATFENINFVPADGVNTTLTINYEGVTNPDYLIVANGNDIMSRWFVIESDVIRGGQYSLTLHRDLLVDSYDMIIKAPCFIEKATLSANDPMIFNTEDMTFNQIKTSETPLKDETGCAWVVGYIPKDSFSGDETSRTVEGDVILGAAADITVENLSDWSYYDKMTGFRGYFTEAPIFIGQALLNNRGVQMWARFMSQAADYSYNTNISNKYPAPTRESNALTVNSLAEGDIYNLTAVQQGASANWAKRVIYNTIYLQTYLNLSLVSAENKYKNLNSKIIYESSTGAYYRIRVTQELKENTGYVTSSIPSLFDSLKTYLVRDLANNTTITGEPNNNSFQYAAKFYEYSIALDQIYTTAKVVISEPVNRYHLEDQPYDMFCMPYSDDLQIYKNGAELLKANKSVALNIATQIGAATGSDNIYDIQLLPYCPVRYCIMDDDSFDVKATKCDLITDTNGNNVGILLWATSSSFTLDILHTIESTNPKVENLTDKWRLCSPNYNGQFEFSVAMNGGVTSFNVDCTYKPFNPYIHVNPNFGRLYGKDFNDARGLLCGGDFSLPQVSNAWANYQLNNKNYQSLFDREIQNLQVTQKYERISDIASAVTGTVSGGVGGAMVGGKVGTTVGGLLSAAGGVADVYINEQLRAEALDYKKDMFGYQLGNIQALPTNLSKTTAFTYNNKIFPILEYYTCTSEEKTALENKIKYNGMSVGRIGTISEFLGNATDQYIKGRVIRLEGVSDDFHYFKAISDEIYKGAFF